MFALFCQKSESIFVCRKDSCIALGGGRKSLLLYGSLRRDGGRTQTLSHHGVDHAGDLPGAPLLCPGAVLCSVLPGWEPPTASLDVLSSWLSIRLCQLETGAGKQRAGRREKFLGLTPTAAAITGGCQVASGQRWHLFGSSSSGKGIVPVITSLSKTMTSSNNNHFLILPQTSGN